MIEAHAFVGLPAVVFVIPEGPKRAFGLEGSQRVGPALREQMLKGLAAGGLNQSVAVERSSGVNVLRCRNDVVVACQDDGHARAQQLGGMANQTVEPGEFVIELRARLRIAVGQVERRDQDSVHGRFDVAGLGIVGIAGESSASHDRIAFAGEDGYTVPGALALPCGAVTEGAQVGNGERTLFGFQFLQTDYVGFFAVKPGEQVGEPLIHSVDVEGCNLHVRRLDEIKYKLLNGKESMNSNYKVLGGMTALFAGLAIASMAMPAAKVRIGYCGPLKDIPAAKAAGFDYMEMRTSEVAALSDADYQALAAQLKRLDMPVPAAYWLVPAEVKVTGPNVDKNQQSEYLKKALDRVSRLGVRLIVFGSSGARNFPEGFPKQEAFAQLVDFGKRAGPIARDYGITIAIEPQRKVESNIINSTQEALAWVEAVNDPNIQLMIDYYHFEIEKEDPAMVAKVSGHLRHLHMANPNNRVMPLSWTEYNYAPFFAALRQIGYDKLIGLEASSSDLQVEGPKSIALLRHAFGE